MKKKTKGRASPTRRSLLLSLLVAVALPLTIQIGCSSDPVSPTTSYFDLPYQETDFEDIAISAAKRQKTQEPRNVDVGFVGSGNITVTEGGTFSMNESGSAIFIVEPNSIPQDTTINATVVFSIYHGKSIGLFNFSPNGLLFSTSATIQIDIKLISNNSNSLRLYWLNIDRNKWEYQGTYAADASDLVSLPIDHFSKYGVSN